MVLVANLKLLSLLIGRLVMTSNDFVVVNQLKQAYKDLIYQNIWILRVVLNTSVGTPSHLSPTTS